MPSGKQKPRSQGWGRRGEWSQRRGAALLRKIELLELDHPIPAQTDSQEEVPQPCHTSSLDCCPWSAVPQEEQLPTDPGGHAEPPGGRCEGAGGGGRVLGWVAQHELLQPQEAISSHQACPSWEAAGGGGCPHPYTEWNTLFRSYLNSI